MRFQALLSGSIYGLRTIGWKFYLLFFILPIVAGTGTSFIAKDTKGLTLEEVGASFGDELVATVTHLDEMRIGGSDEHHYESKQPAAAHVESVY